MFLQPKPRLACWGFRPLWGSFLFLFLDRFVNQKVQLVTTNHHYPFPSPMGFFFISIMDKFDELNINKVQFPSPMGFFFISIYYNPKLHPELCKFPSPMGIFFISILSYGNLMEHSENLHFAVQRFSLLQSGDLKHFKVLYPLIICLAVQNYDSTSPILPIP